MKVSEQQKQEWVENPVTLAVKEFCQKEYDSTVLTSGVDCLIRGEPQLTQENIVELANKEHEWGIFIDLLEGDWTDLEIEDEE